MPTNNIAKEGWEFIKTNFKWLLVAALFVFVYFKQGCNIPPLSAPVVTRDTVWIQSQYQSPAYQPPIVNVIPSSPQVIQQPQYRPDTSYMGLLRQYQALVNQLTTKNVYNDRILLDSVGHVDIADTVTNNTLAGRSYSYKYSIPKETITITQPYKPRNQVFLGAGTNLPTFDNISIGAILKNKKDDMLGIAPNYNIPNNKVGFHITYYKLLKFHK